MKTKTVACLASWTLMAVVAAVVSGAEFASDVGTGPERVWIGPDYWANPMEDWSISAGQLQCRGGGNRNVALLTRTITGKAAFKMSVRFGQLAAGPTPGTVGFRIGMRDEVDDYRAAALRGKGIDIGLDAKARKLFIGRTTSAEISAPAKLDAGSLVVSGTPAGGRMTLELTMNDAQGQRCGSVNWTVPADRVRGLVALVVNHQAKRGPGFWFANWNLSGAGVTAQPDHAWGPILWAMHTLNHGNTDDGVVLKLTAQLVPDGGEGSKTASLSIAGRDDVQIAKVDRLACNATFRVPKWDARKATKYTVRYGTATYSGVVRAEPLGRPLVVAGFTGNQDYLFPNNRVAHNVAVQDPDVLFFRETRFTKALADMASCARQPIRRMMHSSVGPR